MFLSRKDHVLPEMVRRRIVVIKNEENKSHNSTVGYRCNTIIEKCKEIAVIQERKKIKNAMRSQQPQTQQGGILQEKQQKQKNGIDLSQVAPVISS